MYILQTNLYFYINDLYLPTLSSEINLGAGQKNISSFARRTEVGVKQQQTPAEQCWVLNSAKRTTRDPDKHWRAVSFEEEYQATLPLFHQCQPCSFTFAPDLVMIHLQGSFL